MCLFREGLHVVRRNQHGDALSSSRFVSLCLRDAVTPPSACLKRLVSSFLGRTQSFDDILVSVKKVLEDVQLLCLSMSAVLHGVRRS